MEHFFENIPGWFAFRPLYDDALKEVRDGAHFVEVGSWKGRSAAYMAVEIINSGKAIRFDCVDHWLGTKHTRQRRNSDVVEGRLFEVFLDNVRPVRDAINVIRKDSLSAALDYPDESLDFVMIDGAHDYQSVAMDIAAWWPKIRPGGTLAGDDWVQEGVNRAVTEAFGAEVETFLPPVPGESFGQWRIKKIVGAIHESPLPCTSNVEQLRAYARNFPSQGGVEIGPWLEEYAAKVPPGSAIVEVGCWLGAGTAMLSLGAKRAAETEIHVFDRFQAGPSEVIKAARFGVELKKREDTLERVMRSLSAFEAPTVFHKGDLMTAEWIPTISIGLYVDDASKREAEWRHSMATFSPAFIPGETIVVLMDYHFDEKAGEQYAAQKRWIAEHKNSFELICERMGGTSAAVFLYHGPGGK